MGAEAVIRKASADWLSEPISSASSSSSGKIFCRPVTMASDSSRGLIVCSAISRSLRVKNSSLCRALATYPKSLSSYFQFGEENFVISLWK